MDQSFAIVIPAYNEAATIRDLVQRALLLSPHVIVVDDGSADRTSEELVDLPIILLRQPYNQGKAAALWRGFQAAAQLGVAFIVTLDGDGQHAPEDIPRLMKVSAPNTIVIGARLKDKKDIPWNRYWANKFANFWISWAAGYPIMDSQSGFRIYPVSICQITSAPKIGRAQGFVFESAVLIDAGRANWSLVFVQIAAVYAQNARSSHFHPVQDIKAITLMVAKNLLCRGLAPISLFKLCTHRVRNTHRSLN